LLKSSRRLLPRRELGLGIAGGPIEIAALDEKRRFAWKADISTP
jgi:hypothetical protein